MKTTKIKNFFVYIYIHIYLSILSLILNDVKQNKQQVIILFISQNNLKQTIKPEFPNIFSNGHLQ